jgi:drug/metabolite transporter (DMT)-like permease
MGFEIGIIFAFGAMLFWGIGDFFIQKSTRKVGDVEALFFIGLFGSIVLFPFIIKDIPFLFQSRSTFFVFLILAAINLVASLLNLEAYRIGKLAVIDSVIEIELLVTMLLAVIIAGEIISVWQLVFCLALFVGIVLVGYSGKAKINLLEKGVIIALLAAIGLGTVNFLIGTLVLKSSPLFVIWFVWFMSTIPCFIYAVKKNGFAKLSSDIKGSYRLLLAEGFFDTVAWVSFAFAMVSLPIAIATAITESYPAVAVLLGIFINREVIKKHQVIGIILALGCTILLSQTI